MVGTLVFRIMAEIDLIKNLEHISFIIPNILLKLENNLYREDPKEFFFK